MQGILSPIISRLQHALTLPGTSESHDTLVNAIDALTACFKGLTPSEEDIFDVPDEDEQAKRDAATMQARSDGRIIDLRSALEMCMQGLVHVFQGDGEVADVSWINPVALTASRSPRCLSNLPCHHHRR